MQNAVWPALALGAVLLPLSGWTQATDPEHIVIADEHFIAAGTDPVSLTPPNASELASLLQVQYDTATQRVSVELEQAPLDAVLSLLAQQADIQLVLDPAGSHVTLTAQFTDLALPIALKRLLRQQNYVLVYAPDTRKSVQSPTPRVSELHILNASAPRSSELLPETSGQPVESSDVLADLLLALETADTPAARIEVLETIAANDLEQLLAVLSKALQENATAEAIAERLTALPAGLLSELVQTAPDASTRIHALALLGELGQNAAETLAETLPEDAHVYAAQLLDAFHDDVFVPAIDSALLDDDPQVREAALAALENLPDTAADEELLSNLVLSDPVPELRLNALELLAETDRALAFLQQALSDPDPRVSKAASTLLRNLKP